MTEVPFHQGARDNGPTYTEQVWTPLNYTKRRTIQASHTVIPQR